MGKVLKKEVENVGFAQTIYSSADGRLYCWQVDGWYTWEGKLTNDRNGVNQSFSGDCGSFIANDLFFFGFDKEPTCYSRNDVRLQLYGFTEQVKANIARATAFNETGVVEFVKEYTYTEPEIVEAVEEIVLKFGERGIPENIFNGAFARLCEKHGQRWTPRHIEITSNGRTRVKILEDR